MKYQLSFDQNRYDIYVKGLNCLVYIVQTTVKSWVFAKTSVPTVYKWYRGTGLLSASFIQDSHYNLVLTIEIKHDWQSWQSCGWSDNPQLERIHYLYLENLYSTVICLRSIRWKLNKELMAERDDIYREEKLTCFFFSGQYSKPRYRNRDLCSPFHTTGRQGYGLLLKCWHPNRMVPCPATRFDKQPWV